MAAAAFKTTHDPSPRLTRAAGGAPLAALATLGDRDIEASLASNLSADLHALFDRVSDGALPIYFGPLLGRLYLEGL